MRTSGRFALLDRSAVALALLLPSGALAQDLGVRGGVTPVHSKGRFSMVVENDLFTFGSGTRTDRFYTNGVYLHSEWGSPSLEGWTRRWSFGRLRSSEDRAFLGVGLSHELHTPETTNPCGDEYHDPLATSDAPGAVGREACERAENTWRDEYRDRDHPFSAAWSVFVTAQRYFDAGRDNGLFSQLRLWGRADLGAYGEDAARGYEVQKNWHGFFNDALLGYGDDPAATPKGWQLGDPGTDANVLAQLSAGFDLGVYRLSGTVLGGPLGFELDARAHVRTILPRNDLGAGPVLRAGFLPEHASEPMKLPGEYQTSAFYGEASADAVAVFTDATEGDVDQIRHFQDRYTLGLTAKLMGLAASASLNWERILFRDPLQAYPSRSPIEATYHRYGRVAVEFSY